MNSGAGLEYVWGPAGGRLALWDGADNGALLLTRPILVQYTACFVGIPVPSSTPWACGIMPLLVMHKGGLGGLISSLHAEAIEKTQNDPQPAT